MKRNHVSWYFYTLMVIMLITITIPQVCAANTKVLYSGFAFLGEHTDINKQYKYSSKVYELKDEQGVSKVEQTLRKLVTNVKAKDLEIVLNQLGDINSGEGLSLAVALDWEDVSSEELEKGLVKSVYNLHGQVLVFDFTKMEIVYCYPFGVRVTDSTPDYPSEEHKLSIFRKLYLEDIAGVSFLNTLSGLIKDIRIKTKASCLTFKVEDVVFEPKAEKFFSKNYPNEREQALKIFLAQQFSSFFTRNLKLSILPYTKGQGIGNKMAGRFANGDIFELQIPEGDYPIILTIRGFKKAKLDKNATGESWAYGSYARIIIKSALGKIVNTKVKNGAVKIVPYGQEDVADRSAFVESLLVLFDKTTKQIKACDSKWLKKCAEGDVTEKQFKKLKRKIDKY